MQLHRPLCFFDLETTGTDVSHDRIVEIAVVKVDIDGTETEKVARLNPGIPIPKEASDVHGITDDMVKDCPSFVSISKSLLALIDGCDIAGYNSNRFDVPILANSFQRAGLRWKWNEVHLIDVCNIYKIREERTLSAAMKFYCGVDHDEAHGALPDAKATKDIFAQQLKKYPDLPKNLSELALYSNYGKEIVDLDGKFSKDKDGDIIFNFGQHKGKKAKTEKGFLMWMVNKADFSPDTKRVANELSFL